MKLKKILAACLHILNLIYDPKLKTVIDYMNLLYYVDVKKTNLIQLKNFVDKIFDERTQISRQIKIYNGKLARES